MVGFGEFVMNDNATKENPDSWMRMMSRLEAMQKVREKLPNTTVTVGEGPEKRTVTLNGQPSAMTLEMNTFTEVVTDADKKRADKQAKAIADAFTAVDEAYGTSVMKNATMKGHLEAHRYADALALLKKEVAAVPAPEL